MSIAENFKAQSIDIDQKYLAQGINDVLADGERLLTDEQVAEVMQNFQQQQMEKMRLEQEKLATDNKAKGDA